MKNEIKYPRDMSFIDRQGNVVRPSREDYEARRSVRVSETYAFFDCDASEDYLKEVMQEIVEDPESPKGLELAVQEGVSGLKLDKKLIEAIQYPDDYRIMSHERRMKEPERDEKPAASLKYSLVTKCPGLSNKDTAERTGNIMNYVRTLNEDSDMFRCALAYKTEGEYHLLRL